MIKDNEIVYITFGQSHAHRVNGTTFDCNSVAQVAGGRERAFELFGGKFFTTYTKEQIKDSLHYFPRGVIDVDTGEQIDVSVD